MQELENMRQETAAIKAARVQANLERKKRKTEPEFAYLAGYRKGEDVSLRGFRCLAVKCCDAEKICDNYCGTEGEEEKQGDVLIKCIHVPIRMKKR
jgi:hypothetical protein